MPCRYDPSPEELEEQFQRRALKIYRPKLDELTRLLCMCCAALERKAPMPAEVARWWAKHKNEDEDEARAARAARIRADVLARLSPQEREAFEEVLK